MKKLILGFLLSLGISSTLFAEVDFIALATNGEFNEQSAGVKALNDEEMRQVVGGLYSSGYNPAELRPLGITMLSWCHSCMYVDKNGNSPEKLKKVRYSPYGKEVYGYLGNSYQGQRLYFIAREYNNGRQEIFYTFENPVTAIPTSAGFRSFSPADRNSLKYSSSAELSRLHNKNQSAIRNYLRTAR